MPIIKVRTSGRSDMVDITREVAAHIPKDLDSGICHLFCLHTTAGLTVNENADPDVTRDMLMALDKIVPWNDSEYRHMEGNSAAHVKSSMMDVSLSVPIESACLVLGTWQSIYFCEFDGPRNRTVHVQFAETL